MSAIIQPAYRRMRTVQGLVLIVLMALALVLAAFTDGTWHGSIAPLQIVLALAGIGLYASIWALTRRSIPTLLPETAPVAAATPEIDTALPVFYASQTGTAEMYARQCAQAMTDQGLAARAEPLEALTPERLRGLTRALFIASTTDDGNAPYPVSAFVRQVMGTSLPLPNLHYGLLALGDSYYDTFCGFGRDLDAWLQAQGAQALFPRIEVDDNDPAALDAWREQLAQLAGTDMQDSWQAQAFLPWRLQQRVELNPGSLGEPTFLLQLVPEGDQALHWEAGDIAEIRPRHGSATLDRWLAVSGLDGEQLIPGPSGSTSLREHLAWSELPEPESLRGKNATQLAEALVELRHRDYSIASLPGDGCIELLVRQGRRSDGSLSLGAAWLTRDAEIGARIDLRLRSNANFRAPDDASPLILIGNGTGLAGLRALLRQRIAQGRLRNWLIFGERQQACDFYYREELEAMLAKRQLAYLDLAFSRDGPQRVYVQDRLLEQAERVRDWVSAGATLCVCGSQDGMAAGVDTSLRQILGDEAMQALTESGRYRRDVY